jgi:DNA repair photolyase
MKLQSCLNGSAAAEPRSGRRRGVAGGCRLRARKSQFVQIFRTTPARTVCPNFYVLSHANGCRFKPRCTYCYLMSSFWYLREDQAFTNVDKIVREIRRWMGKHDLESYVLNTGNLSDSLTFEDVRPLMGELFELFRQAEGKPHTLLLVTKGGREHCRFFMETKPCANVVVSFSVNAPAAARKMERGAALVSDRLAAARALKKRGWRVRMRLDPLIWGYDYAGVIDAVRRLAPERVTLGTLRAEPGLLKMGANGIFKELVLPDEPNGLARYSMARRLALYRPAVKALRQVCPVALCEEEAPVWDALGLDKEARLCNCNV